MLMIRVVGVGLLIASVALLSMDGANMGAPGSATLSSVESVWSLLDAASLAWLRWQTESALVGTLLRTMLALPAGPFAAVIGLLALWAVHRGDRVPDHQVPVLLS